VAWSSCCSLREGGREGGREGKDVSRRRRERGEWMKEVRHREGREGGREGRKEEKNIENVPKELPLELLVAQVAQAVEGDGAQTEEGLGGQEGVTARLMHGANARHR